MTQPAPRKSDLGVRTVSAVVMVAVAGAALWLGGWWWTAFVAAVTAGVMWEWLNLVREFAPTLARRAVWMAAGLIYVCVAAMALIVLRERSFGLLPVLMPILGVIAADTGAYFAGRTIGGPKIAPSISPSKTWAGLLGGMIAAAVVMIALAFAEYRQSLSLEGGCAMLRTCIHPLARLVPLVLSGFLLAVLAQAGDFFQSWMKRRAGVKDSGSLLPGHGGLFDRADGLIAVSFAMGLFLLGDRLA